MFNIGVNDRAANALNTVRAFLHDPATSYGHVRVVLQTHTLGCVIRIGIEIEAPHFIRTVIGAEAGAYAALINHIVEPVRAMNCGLGRANIFTRSQLAMHAEDRLKVNFTWLLSRSFDIPVDP